MADLKEKVGGPPLHVFTPHSSPDNLHLGQSSHQISFTHNHRYFPVIEILHGQDQAAKTIDHRLTQVDLGRLSVQAVLGGRAFRQYHALSETVVLNKAGNLRGMVASARWRTLFRLNSEVGEYMANIGYLAGLAAEITESAPKIEAILKGSDNSVNLMGLRISALAGTIAQRALLGIVPSGAHMIYRSLEGWCMIAGLAGGKIQSDSSKCIQTLKEADALVQTGFRFVTDTSNQSKAVWWIIDIMTSSRSR
jgi:hypothetical protein